MTLHRLMELIRFRFLSVRYAFRHAVLLLHVLVASLLLQSLLPGTARALHGHQASGGQPPAGLVLNLIQYSP